MFIFLYTLMDTLRAIQKRRAVHKFRNRPLPDRVLKEILEAGRWAPSAGNIQSVRLIVVEDDDKKKELADACLSQNWMIDAPIIVVLCSHASELEKWYGDRGRQLYAVQDVTLAAQNIMLAATSLGVGSCFVSAFSDSKVRRVLKIPDLFVPYAIIPIGYASEHPRIPTKFRLWDITFWNSWENRARRPDIFPLSDTLKRVKKKVKKRLTRKKPSKS